MQRIFFLIAIFFIGVMIISCHKKNYPSRTTTSNVENNEATASENKSDSIAIKPAVVKKKKEPLPKVIAVNDNAAHKSVDGRLYYDIMGHRYWKNYKDGKYYLFNKSMFSDPAFKAPQ